MDADVSIHTLREKGDPTVIVVALTSKTISIHALREEGDNKSGSMVVNESKFLSTPSARRAT